MWTLQGHWQALLKHDVFLNRLKGGRGLKKEKPGTNTWGAGVWTVGSHIPII